MNYADILCLMAYAIIIKTLVRHKLRFIMLSNQSYHMVSPVRTKSSISFPIIGLSTDNFSNQQKASLSKLLLLSNNVKFILFYQG